PTGVRRHTERGVADPLAQARGVVARGSVVDHEHVERVVRLALERVEAGERVVQAVPVEHDHERAHHARTPLRMAAIMAICTSSTLASAAARPVAPPTAPSCADRMSVVGIPTTAPATTLANTCLGRPHAMSTWRPVAVDIDRQNVATPNSTAVGRSIATPDPNASAVSHGPASANRAKPTAPRAACSTSARRTRAPKWARSSSTTHPCSALPWAPTTVWPMRHSLSPETYVPACAVEAPAVTSDTASAVYAPLTVSVAAADSWRRANRSDSPQPVTSSRGRTTRRA